MKPTIEQVIDAIRAHFPDAIVAQDTEYDFNVLTVKKDSVVPILTFLFKDENFQFRYLTTLCGLHFPDSEKPFKFRSFFRFILKYC